MLIAPLDFLRLFLSSPALDSIRTVHLECETIVLNDPGWVDLVHQPRRPAVGVVPHAWVHREG
jgi:hypothetical protein